MTEELRAAIADALRHDLWPDDGLKHASDETKAEIQGRCLDLADKIGAVLAAHGAV